MKRGFSVIELLLALSIGVVIMIAITHFFGTITTQHSSSERGTLTLNIFTGNNDDLSSIVPPCPSDFLFQRASLLDRALKDAISASNFAVIVPTSFAVGSSNVTPFRNLLFNNSFQLLAPYYSIRQLFNPSDARSYYTSLLTNTFFDSSSFTVIIYGANTALCALQYYFITSGDYTYHNVTLFFPTSEYHYEFYSQASTFASLQNQISSSFDSSFAIESKFIQFRIPNPITPYTSTNGTFFSYACPFYNF